MIPSAAAVLNLLRAHPNDGVCARTFAMHDIYRFGARIHELRQLGYLIEQAKCHAHLHVNHIPAYHLRGGPDE